MPWKCLSHWEPPNSNFFPISLVSVADKEHSKTVIMVASAEQVLCLSLPDADRAISETEIPVTFSQCGFEHYESLREIKATDENVIAVTLDGQLMAYDHTRNKFRIIDRFSNVLHLEYDHRRNALFIVRQTTSEMFVLEVFELIDGIPAHGRVESYELVAVCIDSEAKFSIKNLIVNATNERFLTNFLGFKALSIDTEILLIAINNDLYWLQQQATGQHDLVEVRCFASNVTNFVFFEGNLSLAVLLEAGILTIFSQSSDPDTLLVANSSVYLHTPIEDYAFDDANNAFVYSNGFGAYRHHSHYSEETKRIQTVGEEIPVRGVVAITFLEADPTKILFLTENGQFYSVARRNQQQLPEADASKMFVLKGDRRTTSNRITKRLTDEVQFEKRLEEAINDEQEKFNVLALHRNRMVFEKLSCMEIKFHHEMPSRQTRMFHIGKQENVCLFARIKITINRGFYELLSQQKQWNICLVYNEELFIHPVHETFDDNGVLNAVVFLCKSELAHGLPKIRSFLQTTVKHGYANLMLNIHLSPVTDSIDKIVESLIQRTECRFNPTMNRCLTRAALDIMFQHNPDPGEHLVEKRQLTYYIRNEQSKSKAVHFSSVLENNCNDTWSVLDEPVHIDWLGGRTAICLRTFHPMAMDMVKRFLFPDQEYGAEIEQRMDNLKRMFLELQAVADTKLIIQLYRRIRNNDAFEDGLPLDSSAPS